MKLHFFYASENFAFWISFVLLLSYTSFDFPPLAMGYSLLRSLGGFEPTTELFSSYLERLDQFFIANDIGQCAADATDAVRQAAEKKKVVVLISVMGKTSYNTLRDLCMPDSPKDKKFKELCDLLKFHYKPKSLEVAGTFK